MCEPMEPYPDPFIGGYELANMVEVDLRRNIPVTEILAEPEPEPENEPEPESEPEPEPAPEPEPEPIIEPLIEMPPLITEYIPGRILFIFFANFSSKNTRYLHKVRALLVLYPYHGTHHFGINFDHYSSKECSSRELLHLSARRFL